MAKTYNTEPIKIALQTAKTFMVLLPQNPSLDAVAAALALYLSLNQKGLNPIIGCSTPMTVNFNRLFAIDKIKPHIGNQNLAITFPYPEDSVEKVSYNIDNQKFSIVIEPKAGMNPLDSQAIQYSYSGSNADVIFIIGARTLEELGPLYQEEKTLLTNKEKTIINLSTQDKNAQFGTVNIYDPTASGCSEITFSLLQTLNLPLNADIGTNLLAGIETNTSNFTAANVSADTFAFVSQLIKLGAKKGYLQTAADPSPQFSKTPSALRPQSTSSFLKQSQSTPALSRLPSIPSPLTNSNSLAALSSTTTPSTTPPVLNQPITSSTPPVSSPSSPPRPPLPPSSPSTPTSVNHHPSTTPASPDWLKPKVYKSSGFQT